MDEGSAIHDSIRERAEDGWLVLEYPQNPTIRLDTRLLDRILVNDAALYFEVGEVRVVHRIASGAATARAIAESLIQYTRAAPLTGPEAYEHAKRRLAAIVSGAQAREAPSLFVGDDAAYASDDVFYLGEFKCLTSDITKYALGGYPLPLPNGEIQASLAALVVAARSRKEDVTLLARRIADYEATRPS